MQPNYLQTIIKQNSTKVLMLGFWNSDAITQNLVHKHCHTSYNFLGVYFQWRLLPLLVTPVNLRISFLTRKEQLWAYCHFLVLWNLVFQCEMKDPFIRSTSGLYLPSLRSLLKQCIHRIFTPLKPVMFSRPICCQSFLFQDALYFNHFALPKVTTPHYDTNVLSISSLVRIFSSLYSL